MSTAETAPLGPVVSDSKKEVIGAVLGLGAALTTAAYLLLFREAAESSGRWPAVFAVLLSAALCNSVVAAVKLKSLPHLTKEWKWSVVFLGSMAIMGNLSLAFGLPRLGEGVMSTMMQLQVFFIALGASIFLKERAGASVLFGGGLALVGVAVFALPNAGAEDIELWGIAAAILTSLCFSAMIVWTRAVIHNVEPVSLNAARLYFASFGILLWPGVWQEVVAMPASSWGYAACAGALGPTLGRLCIMYALRYIAAAKTKLYSMTSPIWAFFFVFLIFGKIPGWRELAGGSLIVGGVLLSVIASLRVGQRSKS